jgi:hypothetical protein
MKCHSRSFLGAAILGSAGFLGATVAGQASGDRTAAVSDRQSIGAEGQPAVARRDPKDPAPRAMLVGSPAGCVDEVNLGWLTTVRPLPDCWSFGGFHYADDQDINRDGEVDFVNPVWGVQLMKDGQALPAQCLGYLYTTSWDGSAVEVSYQCIASTDQLVQYVAGRFPGQSVAMNEIGWRDLDGDGDLDLIVELRVNEQWETSAWVWLENTGYEASSGLAGDINRDGAIDGLDLAIVLAGWTG